MRSCPYCGEQMRKAPATSQRPKGMKRTTWRAMQPSQARVMTRDHIVPRCHGGRRQDIITVCYCCNQEKGSLSLAEYRAVRLVRYGSWLFAFERRIPSLLLQLCIYKLSLATAFLPV